MNLPAFAATLWRHKQYGVAVAGAVLIVLGTASLVQRETFPGWYAVSAGALLIVLVAGRAVLRRPRPGGHSERNGTN